MSSVKTADRAGLWNGRVVGIHSLASATLVGFGRGAALPVYGYVNGLGSGASGTPDPATRSRVPLPRSPLGVVLNVTLVVAVAALAFYVLSVPAPRGDSSTLRLDGLRGDWEAQGIAFHSESQDEAIPSLELAAYAMHRDGSSLWFAVVGWGPLFADPWEYDGVYVFLDTDGNPGTGYALRGLGAERLVRVVGGNYSVEGATLLAYESTAPRDWRGWAATGSARAAVEGTFLEIRAADDDLLSSRRMLAGIWTTDFEGNTSESSVAFGDLPGALRVDQRGLGPRFYGSEEAVLELRFTAFGAPVTVGGLTLTGHPAARLRGVRPPFTVERGEWKTAAVVIDATILATGEYVEVSVDGVSADRPVTLVGTPARGYVQAVPGGHRVDGVYEDWGAASLVSDDPDAALRRMDLRRWGSNASLEGYVHRFAFYAETGGGVLEGGAILETVSRPRALGGAGVARATLAQPPEDGSDRLDVWIDADPERAEGSWMAGIFADYWLRVRGTSGRVLLREALGWHGGRWEPLGEVAFFHDGKQAEGGLLLPAALSPGALVVVEATAWSQEADRTMPATSRGTRGAAVPEPAATQPPNWYCCSWLRTDLDDGLADPSLEILETAGDNYWPGGYIYVRFVVEDPTPVLTNNSWWVYLDKGYPAEVADGDNDWLVEELSTGLCSYQWDAANGDWGIGSGCDVTDTLTDADVGSAVRVVNNCQGTNGCIDFALEKSDYPGLGQRPWVTLASDAVEDLNLSGNTNRNPFDGIGGCGVTAFDDCTTRVEIPEFPSAVAVASVPLLLGFLRRLRRRSSRI